jgi:D-lactate dehydrogenase
MEKIRKIQDSEIYFLEVNDDEHAFMNKYFSDDVHIISEQLSEDELIEQCKDARIISCFLYTRITERVLKELPKLELIVTRTAGYDHIDIESCNKHGVTVARVPDYGAHVIAEFTIGMILAAVRHIPKGEKQTQKLHFDWHGLRGMALRGKTLGIIGGGKIGVYVARIASLGFAMNVLVHDPNEDDTIAHKNHFTYVTENKLFMESDIISLHCPLVTKTCHIINIESIKQMKDGVVLVNTARGGLIDTHALVGALKSGKVRTVALDVLEQEKNTAHNEEIMTIENAIITPHIAFYADDSVKRMYDETCVTINHFLNGERMPHKIVISDK